MKTVTIEKFNAMLECKFGCILKKHQIQFIKSNQEEIILYDWKDGGAYKGAYRFFKKKYIDLDEMINFMEHAFKVLSMEKESYFYRDEIMILPKIDGIKTRLLSVEDEHYLMEMQKQCSEKDLQDAQIRIFDKDIVGAFYDDKLVGVASVLVAYGAQDIAVLVHPEYRQKGISKYIVNECANRIVSINELCQYRCVDTNVGSYRTAIALSFEKKMGIAILKIAR